MTTDYATLRSSPSAMIGPDGMYHGGWFDGFDGSINPEDAGRGAGRLSAWLHVTFDTPNAFVGCHLADLGLAGHTAVLWVDKRSQRCDDRSERQIWRGKSLRVDEAFTRFDEPKTGSVIHMTDDGGVVFDVAARGLRLRGRARPAFACPLVQTTVYPGAKGTLQWWGNLELVEGELIRDGVRTRLPKGALGAYDRTVGHRRRIQNWNWLSAVGSLTRPERGDEVPFSLQMSKDRAGAHPQIASQKYAAWVGDRMFKFQELSFDYKTDPATGDTGPWKIDAHADDATMALTFTPRFKRRERGYLPIFYRADFCQFYGDLEGELTHQGEAYRLDPTFALVEDAYLRI